MSKDIKVKPSSVQEFKRKGGYRIVEPIYAADGTTVIRVKHCTLAAEQTGMKRDLIRRIVQQYPTERPIRGEKRAEVFAKLEFAERYRLEHGDDVKYTTNRNIIRKAWSLLNKKPPCSWTETDYKKLWNKDPDFESPFFKAELGAKGGIPENYGTPLRHVMDMCKHIDALRTFKCTKEEKGKYKGWFLNEIDLIGKPNEPKTSLLYHLQDNETLVLVYLGMAEGGRISSLRVQTPRHITWRTGEIYCEERKVRGKKGARPIRTVPECVINLVKRYVEDYKIDPDQKLFGKSTNFYNEQLSTAADEAGIVKPKPVTSHILKHTFVTQAAKRGIPEAEIEKQTGTEARTLMAHYQADDPQMTRHYLRGEESSVASFIDWMRSLEPVFLHHYERIQREGAKVDDYRGKLS